MPRVKSKMNRWLPILESLIEESAERGCKNGGRKKGGKLME